MDRREFLEATGAVAGLLLAAQIEGAASGAALKDGKGEMIYRMLGSTGEKVSAIGLGGAHLGRPKTDDEAVRLVRSAIDRGITFMDNSWDYHDGLSETRMGKALRDGYRAKAFLMTKLDGRTKRAAAAQIDQSLKRLQTDYVDLMQIHEVIRLEDPDRCFNEGCIEALLEAKKAGKLRYIGFTGHKDPLVHLRMLETARRHGFRFDAVQMPLNVMDAHFRSFGKLVVPELVKEGIAVLGMKSMADGHILETKAVTPIECLHYALSLPTSVVINGIDSMKLLDQAFEAARSFKPLSAERIADLLARTAQYAASGRYEPFKTTDRYDSTAQNPDWLSAA